MVVEELDSEEQDDDPGEKDLLGHIQGAVTNETQAWGSVMEEGALREVGALRCTPADGKVTRGEGKDLFHYDPDSWCNSHQSGIR